VILNMLSVVYAARPITTSEWQSDANDASLLWRHSSWIGSRPLKRAYRRPFWRFWGNFNPKMLPAIVWIQKGLPYVTKRVLSHCASKSIHGSLQQASLEKK